MQKNYQDVINTPQQKFAQFLHFTKTKLRHEKQKEVNHFLPLIPEKSIIFDIGSHFGQYAKIFSQIHNKSCEVYCFEPVDYTRSILKRVVGDKNNVHIFDFGFSDKIQTLPIHIPLKKSGKIGPGLSHLGQETKRDFIKQDITLKTIDDFVFDQGLKALDFIKIDIEGAELLAFQGGIETIKAFKPTIFCEIIETNLNRMNATSEDVKEFFKNLGYKIFNSQEGIKSKNITGFNDGNDFIFIHQNKI